MVCLKGCSTGDTAFACIRGLFHQHTQNSKQRKPEQTVEVHDVGVAVGQLKDPVACSAVVVAGSVE